MSQPTLFPDDVGAGPTSMSVEAKKLRRALAWLEGWNEGGGDDDWTVEEQVRRHVLPHIGCRLARAYEMLIRWHIEWLIGERPYAPNGAGDPQGPWPEWTLERLISRRLRTLDLRMMRRSDSPTPAAGSRPQSTTEETE